MVPNPQICSQLSDLGHDGKYVGIAVQLANNNAKLATKLGMYVCMYVLGANMYVCMYVCSYYSGSKSATAIVIPSYMYRI